MVSRSLKTHLLISFFTVILVFSLPVGFLGYYIIKKDIIEMAQQRVDNSIKAARMVYNNEIDGIGEAFRLASFDSDFNELKQKMRLDYLKQVKVEDIATVKSEIVQAAFKQGRGISGTRIIGYEELKTFGEDIARKVPIAIRPTLMSEPTSQKVLTDVMAKGYAMPLYDESGNMTSIVYGGRIINRDFALVDRIRYLVFGDELYDGKPVGTVTIFQNDTRISTNVVNADGTRAIGTQISSEVYKNVFEQGNKWHDRAFVVTSWYKTAYEPLRNIDGKIIGMLYVGILEQPFDDMARQIILLFMAIVVGATVLASIVSLIIAASISKPIKTVLNATRKLSGGELGHEIKTETGVTELDILSQSFNEMSLKLHEREVSLNKANEKLTELNKSYVDLIGFVAHELKGILSSAVINAYSLRDGLLGMINFKQRKAMESLTRNLDYLDATVKKFLNLGRIEKGELPVNKTEIFLKKDIYDVALNSLAAVYQRKNMKVENNIDPQLNLMADTDLMMVVANNLVSNAIKYGTEGGEIRINARVFDGKVEVDVYNDSEPISEEDKVKLFKKFSRLNNEGTRKVKGTGLGLYITSQIIESHGGNIRVEPREKGNSFIFIIERGL